MKQYSFFDDVFVDSFAGGGGASTGIEMATGHPIDIAINHDEAAIMMHSRNHPFTEHYREDIWQVDPKMAPYHMHNHSNAIGTDMNDPVNTVTGTGAQMMISPKISPYIMSNNTNNATHGVDEPCPTITTGNRNFVIAPSLIQYHSEQIDLKYWPQVRALLNTYCDYNIADDEILLLHIRGVWYFISDIGLRMLTPRELYDAMGFPHDYIIDRDVNGNSITRADQVARCGNAVCPAVAEALTRANLPEYCKRKIVDMADLHSFMVS